MRRRKREERLRRIRRLARLVVKLSKSWEPPPPELESLVEALRDLRETFPNKDDSWFERAVVRCLAGVRRIGRDVWIVKGLRELGDYYDSYTIYWVNGRYECDCYRRSWGNRRKVEICTHVAAVMLFRRQRRIVEFL